jgi:hypothetical protein
MSVFDILKYGNTNLRSAVELKALPEDIILEFYQKVIGSPGTRSYHQMCWNLSMVHSPHYDDLSVVFRQVLKERNL